MEIKTIVHHWVVGRCHRWWCTKGSCQRSSSEGWKCWNEGVWKGMCVHVHPTCAHHRINMLVSNTKHLALCLRQRQDNLDWKFGMSPKCTKTLVNDDKQGQIFYTKSTHEKHFFVFEKGKLFRVRLGSAWERSQVCMCIGQQNVNLTTPRTKIGPLRQTQISKKQEMQLHCMWRRL